MTRVEVSVRRLRDGVLLPRYMTPHAAGLDLHAAMDGELTLRPGERALISTGIAISLPDGFEAQVRPRSGLALRHGITLLNSPGTIDPDYRGEVGVILVNLGHEPFTVRNGERIAQLVVAPFVRVSLLEVDALDETSRGQGGFGHTGR